MTTENQDLPALEETAASAIDEAALAVQENMDEELELLVELGRVRDELDGGAPLSEALGKESQPRVLTLFGRVAQRVVLSSARLRRALVRSLLGEGESVSRIARRLGVSHQRVSSVLRRGSTDMG